jgi:hypothetical protein
MLQNDISLKIDCFSVALSVASLIDKETDDKENINKILELTKQILSIG